MNRVAAERLMRFVDGELDAHETALVERWLSESEEARALVRELESLSHGVRAIAEERGARAECIADAVMARVAGEGPASHTQLRAKPSDGRRKERRLQAAIPAIGLALAAAAAAVVYLRPHPLAGTAVGQRPSAAVSPEPFSMNSSTADLAVAELEEGASIESVDFGAQNGTIFLVPAGPQVTPVVWLMDDGDPSSG